MRLADALAGITRLGLDTAPVIYFIEANPQYGPLVREIFRQVSAGTVQAITSTITLSEVLVKPIERGDVALQQQYVDFLVNSTSIQALPVYSTTATLAAGIRATYRLKTPDALQIAVAIESNCEALLTNDLTLKRVTELRILALDEMEL